jgi:hypothetical protein
VLRIVPTVSRFSNDDWWREFSDRASNAAAWCATIESNRAKRRTAEARDGNLAPAS